MATSNLFSANLVGQEPWARRGETDQRLALVTTGPWVAWTPTWTNLTVGNGVTIAKYARVGKTTHLRVKFTLGSTSSVGTDPYFSLPFTAASDYFLEWPLGPFVMVDNATKAYSGYIQFRSTTAVVMRNDDGLGSFSTTTATSPFTWGTADYFMASATYEAA